MPRIAAGVVICCLCALLAHAASPPPPQMHLLPGAVAGTLSFVWVEPAGGGTPIALRLSSEAAPPSIVESPAALLPLLDGAAARFNIAGGGRVAVATARGLVPGV